MRRDLRHNLPRGLGSAFALVLALGTLADVARADEDSGLQRRRAPIVQPAEPRSGVGSQSPNPGNDTVPIGDPDGERLPRVPPLHTPVAGESDSTGLWAWLAELVARVRAWSD
jgi:hypothetical protein